MFPSAHEDLRYACRRMLSQPGFTTVAVLILAVGIGVTTAMSSTTKAALLSKLPFDEADRLVMAEPPSRGTSIPGFPGTTTTTTRSRAGRSSRFQPYSASEIESPSPAVRSLSESPVAS